MSLQIESVQLKEIVVIVPQVLGDARGFFMETFRADHFRQPGLPTDNIKVFRSFVENKGVAAGAVTR